MFTEEIRLRNVKLRKMSLFLFLFCGICMFFTFEKKNSLLFARTISPIYVKSIVLSKICKETSQKEELLLAINNPDCPQKGDPQLVQVTVMNSSQSAKGVGIVVEVRKNEQILNLGLPKVTRNVAPLDTKRTIYEFQIPNEAGQYQISARIYDPTFRQLLSRSDPGVNRIFYIPSEEELESARNEKVAKAQAALQAKEITFEPVDLKWQGIDVIPLHVLKGEPFRIRTHLMNVGGDIAQNIQVQIAYYNLRLPRRKTVFATRSVPILAAGETMTLELEYQLPEDQILGEYKIVAIADTEKKILEASEENNEVHSKEIRVGDIKLNLPLDQFRFTTGGLFLFQWDSLIYSEFKLQIGTNPNFDDPDTYFDLPQGDRWIADKELVPLSGELPKMALGLMQTSGREVIYWRVAGRRSDGKQSFSDVRSFTIDTE